MSNGKEVMGNYYNGGKQIIFSSISSFLLSKQAKFVDMRVKGAQTLTLALKSFWNTCIEEREGNN